MKRGVVVKVVTLHTGTTHPGRCSLVPARQLGPEERGTMQTLATVRMIYGDFHLVVVDQNSFVQQALLLGSHHKVMSLILTSVQ